MFANMKGKSALVTGAGLGIGRSVSVAFAELGVNIVVADINKEAGLETVSLVEEKGAKAVFSQCDVTNLEQVQAAIALAESNFGQLDFACNNAGIHPEVPPNPVAELSEEIWDLTINVNLRSVFLCMKEELKAMSKHGKGAIVNVASLAGLFTEPESPAYTAAKHGVIGLTKATAFEYARSGIRVNAVCPAPVDTPMLQSAPVEAREHLKSMLPAGRFATPEEVANACVFLCSDAASYIQGVGLPIDGGVSVI